MLGEGRDRNDMLQRLNTEAEGEGVTMAKCPDRKWRGAARTGGAH